MVRRMGRAKRKTQRNNFGKGVFWTSVPKDQ